MNKYLKNIIGACADATFPGDGPIPISGTQAGVVEHFWLSLKEAPKDKRFLLILLLLFVQFGSLVFGPKRKLFTRLSQKEREESLTQMSKSTFYFRRLCFGSLRMMLCMAYMANQQVYYTITGLNNFNYN
jgi:hypothetical protein